MKLIGYRCSQQLSSSNHSILFPWDSWVFLAIGPQRSANKPINFRHSVSSPTLSSSLDNIFMIDVITWMKSYLLCTIDLTGNNYWLTRFFRYYSWSIIFSIITTRNDRAYPFSCHSRKPFDWPLHTVVTYHNLEIYANFGALSWIQKEQSKSFLRFMWHIPTFYLKAD